MKNISKRLLSFVLAVMMVVSMMPTTVFAENADTADLTISTADELKAFADAVNAGNSYEGKTVVLTDDIDLKYTAVVIGTKASPFKGTFDGQGHTVDNLSIYEDGSDSDYFADTDDCLGLFGVINAPAVIKNVTVNNPYIVGSSYVGGIVGMGYTGTIENCHVTGEIDIEGHYMVGGINGHGYAKISNSSVIGAEGWDYNYIGATYKEADLEGDNVGGIVGHNGENNDIVGCTVKNVTVSGTRKIGGIVGIASLGSSITDCVVEGVTVETTATADYAADNGKTMSMGGLVGQYQNRDSGGTITGCTVTDLTFSNVNEVTIHAGALTGGVRGTDAAVGTTEPAITVSGNSISGVTGATVTYMEPEAPAYAVMIGEQGYDTLAEALTAAAAITGDVTVEIYDKVTLNSNLTGSFDSIKFVGKDTDAEIYLDVQGYITATGKKVAFEDLTLSKSTGAFITNAGFMNVAFGVYDVTEVTYTGCTFANGAYASSGEVTYTDCTFYRSHEKYGLWAYGNVDVTVDDCTFADYRGIKMYAEGAAKTVALTVKNTDFSALDSKPAIVLTYGESVTLEGNTYSSTGVFELDLDGAPNGTAVTSDVAPTCKNDNGACGVLVDGKIYTTVEQAAAVATEGSVVTLLHDSAETVELAEGVILNKNGFAAEGVTVKQAGLSGSGTEEDPYMIYTVEDLIFFRDSINEGETIYNASGVYVALGADIDLADIDWSVNIGDDCNATFDGIFDGKDNTIYNLTSTETAQKSDGYICTGLFGAIYGTAAIKNLTIENATISTGDFTGNNVGILIGFAYEAKGTIENVTIRGDIKIDAPGAYGVGAIVGYDYCGKLNITNCTVSGNDGSYIKSSSGVGGVIGYCNAATISGCTVENIAISGKGLVGGIAGLALANTVVKDSAVENVDLTATKDVWVNSAAIAVGTIAANGTTVSNVTFADVTANGAQTSTLVGSTYTEKPTAVVPAVQAKVGDKYYTDLQTAIDAAADGDTITVLRDITLTGSVSIEKNITLDLGGKTITATGTTPLKIKASVTIDNGTLNYSGNDYGAICTYTDDLVLTLGEDLTVTATNDTALYLWKGTVITSAKLICESEDFAAIMTKGDKTANLTINGGEVTGTLTAIYWPCDGKLTINGGTISGATGIYFKSGTLEITDGTIIGNGEQADYQYRSSGWYSTGDALVIENVGADTGYEAIESVSITGGTFKSTKANAVASYTAGNEGVEAVTGFITGGSFNTDVSVYCVDGCEATDADGDGIYEITEIKNVFVDLDGDKVLDEGEEAFSSIYEASRSLAQGATATIVVLRDHTDTTVKTILDGKYSFSVYIANGRQITLDLNGHNIHFVQDTTAPYCSVFGTAYKEASLTIVGDGNITYTANTITQDRLYLFWANSNTTINIEGGSYTTGTSDEIYNHMIYSSGGTINVSGGMFINNVVDNTENDHDVKDIFNTSGTGVINVTGGTYNQNVAKDDQCEIAGGVTVTSDNTLWTGYPTLAEGIAAANDGDTVTLIADVTATDVILIDKSITLDLGGKTLTGADGAIVLNVKADTTITNGAILGNKSGTSSGLIDIYANLTMNGVTMETSKINALRFKAGGFKAVLTDCNITGAFKGYGGSTWEIHSGTYKASSTAISDQLNGTAAVYGGTFYYEIAEAKCAPGYVVVDNGDGTWTVNYAPACFVDADNDGILDEGEIVYGNLDQVFANHQEGDVYVVLTGNIVANGQVDTDADAHYYFTTNVAEGVTMDFLFAEDWNYVQKMTLGENITLNAPYLLAWTDLDIYGTVNTGYAYFLGADVTVHEGGVLNANTGDATVQVKDGTTLTVNGTVNTAILNVWVNDAALVVSGNGAQVNASWIDIWDGTPSVTVENGATLDVDKIKVSRGGTITVDAATLDTENLEIGHNGESAGTVTVTNNGTITKAVLTAVGSAITGPEGMNVTSGVDGYVVVYVDGVYKLAAPVADVNGVKYGTIDEAVENWTAGTTLTLLADVTLTDVITLKSTEHHILNLGTYTMTAADGKNAIEITANGVGTEARSCLTINADTTTPGGITAIGKSCIYYNNANKIADRLMVTINGGVFNGSYAVNSTSGPLNKWGFCTSPLRGQGAPYYVINGGTFDAQVYLNAAMLKVTGGTFNKNLTCMGDSTAHRVISGGTFKSMTMTADAEGKFTIGSAKNVYDVGVYVDDNGYLVVGGPVITEPGTTFVASSTNYGGWSSYLTYSSAATNGLYYTSLTEALADNNKTTGVVTVYVDEIDMTGSTYKGILMMPADITTLTVTFAEGTTPTWTVDTAIEGKIVVYTESVADGVVTRVYRVITPVAQIGETYYETFEEALNAVADGQTITILDVEGSEDVEIDFTKDISFTITGNAPSYALPTITFQNATVTIQDAEILIPELDARQNATINVVDSIVHDAGGNSIVKSYYNGAINISGTSVVYTMQVTTMGYITISDTAKLNATWQTNVYGNGMIVVEDDATFATAALQLIGKDYSGRDNTDADRVGKPATIVVDGANLIVGKVYSDNGADYSYNSSKGINIGTLDGKSAVLDIKNGAEVNIYMANGETANIGANGTVNVDASSLIVSCRAENGTVTLANNGTINISGTSDIAANVTGSGWVYMKGVTLDADTKLIGAKVRFASGTNNIDGSVIDDGFFQVGIGAYNGVDANVDTVNGVVVNVKNATIGSNGSTYAGWIGTGYYDTDAEKAAAMTDAKYVLNIENSIAAFGYLHISNDGEMNVTGNAAEKVWYNNSDYSFYAGEIIVNGTATFDATDVLALYTKVSCDNGTDKPGTINIVNGTEYEAERHNGAIAGNCVVLYKTGVMNVNDADLYIGDLTSIAANAVLNIGANATAMGAITNNGTINLTKVDATLTTPETQNVATTVDGYEVVYEDGTYKLAKKPVYVAYIGEQGYETVEEAVKAAKDGDTIRLDSADTAISMNATVDGDRTITFTGVALVDWTKGNLWIGRNGTGSGKVIFDGVTITSAEKKNPASTGIHVSGAKANSTGTCDGVLEIKNSTIELDYLINRNEVIVSDNSDLTIYGGTYVHGRNAAESDSGTDETATLTVQDSKLTIVNINGCGFGGESYGELILDNAQVACQSAFIVNANGAVKMDANSTITATKLTGAGSIEIDATGVTADKVVITAATADFTGTVSVTGNDSAEAKVNADNIQVAIKELSYVAQNLQTGTKYEDLQNALNEAAEGQTVQLLTDVTAEFIYVGVGKTLDLNGNKLTAGTVSASFTTSHIIDSVGGGLLIVDKENISLNKGNKQLPIWTAEGAIFEEFGFRQRLTFSDDGNGGEVATFDFYIAKDAADTQLDEYLANGTLALRVKATWTSENGTVNTQYFEYTAKLVTEMINAKGWDDAMFYLNLGGVKDISDLTITAEVVSTANSQASVIVSSDPQTRS